MNGDRQEIKGTTKEIIGKATDNPELETEGRVDKAKGKIKNIIAKAIRTIKNALNP